MDRSAVPVLLVCCYGVMSANWGNGQASGLCFSPWWLAGNAVETSKFRQLSLSTTVKFGQKEANVDGRQEWRPLRLHLQDPYDVYGGIRIHIIVDATKTLTPQGISQA